MSKVEWSELEPGAVEQLTGILLCRENPSATRIRPSRGDGGIDVLVPEPNDSRAVTVYQVKGFNRNLTKGQKSQIERSYERLNEHAQATELTVKAWYLTLPLQPTNENRQWLANLTEHASFPCEWRGRDYLDGLSAKYPEVVDYYLHDGKQRLEQAILALTQVLRLQQRLPGTGQQPVEPELPLEPLQPSETIGGLSALHDALNRHDPHYRYDFSVDRDRPPIPDAPYLLAAVQHCDDNRCVTFKIFARFREAVVERPVPGNFEIRAESGSDLQRDLDLFQRFGRPLEATDVAATAELDLPGGLGGGPFEVKQLMLGPAATTKGGYELLLSILDDADVVLVEPLVRMDPSTSGPSGRGHRAFGVEANKAFRFEMLTDLDTGVVQMHLTVGDITGQRPELLLVGLRFLAHFRHPHRLGVRPAYGPGRNEPITIPAEAGIADVTELLELAEALTTIQGYTSTQIEMPDPDTFTRGQAARVKDVAALLRGEALTPPWTTVGPVHLHPGNDPDPRERFSLLIEDPLKIGLPGGEIVLGVRRVHLPAARVDPQSIADHDDHKDVQFIPAGDAPAVISFAGRPVPIAGTPS